MDAKPIYNPNLFENLIKKGRESYIYRLYAMFSFHFWFKKSEWLVLSDKRWH